MVFRKSYPLRRQRQKDQPGDYGNTNYRARTDNRIGATDDGKTRV